MIGTKWAKRGDRGLERTRDHLVPRCLGGGDEASNIVASCGRCNWVRGITPVEQWREFVKVVVRRDPWLGRDEMARRLVLWRQGRWVGWSGWFSRRTRHDARTDH